MKVYRYQPLLLFAAISASWLSAQEVDIMFIERGHVIYQDGAGSSIPIESAGWLGWNNYYFLAGAELGTGSISNFRIAGPNYPLGEPIPFLGEDDGYELEAVYSTASALSNDIPAGTYTFSGTGSSVGAFSENVFLPTYSRLTDRILTNYTELQSFDPAEPVTLAWQEFFEGQGSGGGLIEIEVSYGDGFYFEEVWNSESITPPDAFGLDPTLTSVEIPAGLLNRSPNGVYDVYMFFIRIESLEELGSESKLEGTLLASITTMEMHTDIRTNVLPNPDRLFLTPGGWIYDEKLGAIYGYNPDWGYSAGFGIINVSKTPHWIYQGNLGWLSPWEGSFANGYWGYGPQAGIIWVAEFLGDGLYWSEQAQAYLNMIGGG